MRKKKWNEQLFEAIASSYVHFLVEASAYFVNEEEYKNTKTFYNAVNRYYELYPYWIHHKKNKKQPLEVNCLKLAQLVFEKLWSDNCDILATEIYVNDGNQWSVKVEWNPLRNGNSPIKQAYFQPSCINKKATMSFLRSIKLKMTCAPHELYEHLATKEREPFIATPKSVFQFYCAFHQHIFMHGIPCSIEKSPFESIQTFCEFIKYLLISIPDVLEKEFPEPPWGYPLLLTANGVVCCYDESNKPIKTEFFYLFPESLNLFVHINCFNMQMPETYFYQSVDMSFEQINGLLISNYPHELMQEKCNNSNNCLLEVGKFNSLWECLSSNKDQLLSKHRQQVLNMMALLPSTKKFLYSTRSKILPVVNNVQSLSYGKVEETVYRILTPLGLPMFDVDILGSEVSTARAIEYCPKMTDHNSVLTILFHLHQEQRIFENLSPNNSDVPQILSYLGRTGFVHNDALKKQIKALPIFKSIKGELTDLLNKKVYLWPPVSDFCDDGYDTWAPSDSVVFLEYHGAWRNLTNDFTMIGVSLDEKVIYMDLIFDKFDMLKPQERKSHLKYIRERVFPSALTESKYASVYESQIIAEMFIEKLKNLPCLECPKTKNNANKLKTIKKFRDHRVPVLNIFLQKFILVSEDYRDDEWMEFFCNLGLKKELTPDEFMSFCIDISNGHCEKLKLREASQILFEYLFKEGKEWDDYYLYQIGNISFVVVSDLPNFSWIKTPCLPPHRVEGVDVGLTKLNQAVLAKYSALIWTVKPVVEVPDFFPSNEENKQFLEKLKFTTTPTPNDVISNLINISNSDLSNSKYFFQSNPQFTCKDSISFTKDNVINVIAKSMSFLQDNYENCEDMLSKLCNCACIPVLANPNQSTSDPVEVVLVKPVQVVKRLTSFEDKHLIPYINELPTSLHFFDSVLQKIGILESVELVHVQHMLQLLYVKFEQNTVAIDPNTLETIRCGVKRLGDLLSREQTNKKDFGSTLHPLYLPTKIGNCWSLEPSKKLVFADTSRYKTEDLKKFNLISLFQIPPAFKIQSHQEQVFRTRPLSISMDKVNTMDSRHFEMERKLCLSLPKQVRPVGLSLCTQEKRLQVGTKSEDTHLIAAILKNVKRFTQSLKEILPSMLECHLPEFGSSQKFTSDLISILKSLEIIVIKGLQATVLMNGDEIGTLTSPKFVLERSEDFCYTLFLSHSEMPEKRFWFELSRALLTELAKLQNCRNLTDLFPMTRAIQKCLQIQSNSSLEEVGSCYSVQLSLTDTEMEEEDENEFYPTLGKPFPEKFICRLDNSIRNIFRPQEWVGYEISNENFVWAIVLYPENDKEDSISGPENLIKKFRILVNECDQDNECDQGNECDEVGQVVSFVTLYKIMTEEFSIEEVPEERQLVPVNNQDSSVADRNFRDTQAIKSMKIAICEELKLIWQLPEKEKKTALKRMYLKYHPDKVSANRQTNYNEAFQYLLRQIERLKEGKALEDPNEDTTQDRQISRPSAEMQQFYTQCESYIPRHSGIFMEERSATRRNATSGGGGMPYDWQSRPSSQEAKRWLKQAQSDCEVMRIDKREMVTSSANTVCQVIFLAHEVVEKSLKAGMYALVGLNPSSLTNHELRCHAQSICSQRPAGYSLNGQGRMSVSLVTIATSISHYYLDSRYPNRHPEYLAPVDVYSLADAEEAADYAEMVIEFITRIVMSYQYS